MPSGTPAENWTTNIMNNAQTDAFTHTDGAVCRKRTPHWKQECDNGDRVSQVQRGQRGRNGSALHCVTGRLLPTVDLDIAQRLERPDHEKIGSCCPGLFVKTVGEESRRKHYFLCFLRLWEPNCNCACMLKETYYTYFQDPIFYCGFLVEHVCML